MSYVRKSTLALIFALGLATAALAAAQGKAPTQDTTKRAAPPKPQPPPPTVVRPSNQPPPPTVVRPSNQPPPPTVVRPSQQPPPSTVVRPSNQPPPPTVVRPSKQPPPPTVVRPSNQPPPPTVVRPAAQAGQAQEVANPAAPTAAPAAPFDTGQAAVSPFLPPPPLDTSRRRSAMDILQDVLRARNAVQAGLRATGDSVPPVPPDTSAAGAGAPPPVVAPPPGPAVPPPAFDSAAAAAPAMPPAPMPDAFRAGGAPVLPRQSIYMLIECSPGTDAEPITRGFYVANYRAADLREVGLFFTADQAGDYALQLTARAPDFGGPVVGRARARLRASGQPGRFIGTKFRFNVAGFAPGGTLAFQVELLDGPPGAVLSYVLTNDNACPVTLTENTQPPLSAALGRSLAIRMTGSLP